MNGEKYDVLCIGPAFADLFIKADENMLAAKGFKKGQTYVADSDEFARLKHDFTIFSKTYGGSAANTACCLARLGIKTAVLSLLADDEEGRAFSSMWSKEGIKQMVPLLKGEEISGACAIFLSDDGQRTMWPHYGIQKKFSSDFVNEEMIVAAKVILIASIDLSTEEAREAVLKICYFAKKHHKILAYNLFDVQFVEKFKDFYKKLLAEGLITLLLSNEEEYKAFFEVREIGQIIEIMMKNKIDGVITRGELGAVGLKDGKYAAEMALNVKDVVDTTGAGDSFAAGFIYGLLGGKSFKQCLAKGNQVAVQVVSNVGACPSLPEKLKNF